MVTKRLITGVLASLLMVGACSDDSDPPTNPNNANNTNNNNSNNSNNTTGTNGSNNMDDMGPDMDEEGINIPGLSAPVEVRRDENGMMHIQCASDSDCFAAQGYVHAMDRFAQMDLRRRIARGRVAEIAGNLALSVDEGYRTRFMSRDGEYLEEAFYDRMSPESKAVVDAYTVGVNAWLDDMRNERNGARLSEEYDFPFLTTDVIPDWEPQDTAACALLLMDDLSNSSGVDLRQATYTEDLEADVIYEVLGQISATGNSTLIDLPYTGQNLLTQLPDLQAFRRAIERVRPTTGLIRKAQDRLAPSDVFRQQDGFGSNNWVINGSTSATGKAMLANDPHLGLTNPALWYLVSLDTKTQGGDLRVAGVSFAGIPSILIGQNDNIAWGATVVFYDMADIYVESLDETGTKVNFDGGQVDIIEVEHTYQIANADPVTRTIRVVPHHGPVIEYDEANSEALTLRWTGHEVSSDFDAFFGLAKAENIDDAKAALLNARSTNQNFVVIDTEDNIAWFPYSLVPLRPWASLENPTWMPLDGTGGFEWEGFMDYEDLPQLVNPERGHIITANQDATGSLSDGDPTNNGHNMLQSFPAPGYRHQRIVDLIAGESLTAEDMVSAQGDDYLFYGRAIADAVENLTSTALVDFNEDELRVLNALRAWDGTCPTGLSSSDPDSDASADADEVANAVGCTVSHKLLYHLADSIFGDELKTVPASRAYAAVYIQMITPERFTRSYWDDVSTEETVEEPLEIVLRAITATAASLKQELTTDTDAWIWGRLHVVSFAADLLSNITSDFNNGPFAAPGGLWAVNVSNPSNIRDGNYSFGAGPSMRLVVENTEDGLKGQISFPGGQSHFRDSEYYDNLVEGWLNNEPIALPLLAEDIAEVTVETMTLTAPE